MKFMLSRVKDFWNIFKNSKREFYKEKNDAIELLERVEHINDVVLKAYDKNKEILNYLDLNICDYPKYMFGYINDLVSLFKYGGVSKASTSKSSNFIYILYNVKTDCSISYNSMNENFKKRDFASVKEEYIKLIKNLRDYERRYLMIVLDDFYEYDEI